MEWIRGRKLVLLRDMNKCRVCNEKYKLHVHHIDHNRKNNELENLITLCPNCHRTVHGKQPSYSYESPTAKKDKEIARKYWSHGMSVEEIRYKLLLPNDIIKEYVMGAKVIDNTMSADSWKTYKPIQSQDKMLVDKV